MHTALRKLEKSKNKADFKIAFADMCKKIIGYINKGLLSRQEGCYVMAGFLSIDTISRDSQMFDICLVASELELPDKHIHADIKKKWHELQGLVSEVA